MPGGDVSTPQEIESLGADGIAGTHCLLVSGMAIPISAILEVVVILL